MWVASIVYVFIFPECRSSRRTKTRANAMPKTDQSRKITLVELCQTQDQLHRPTLCMSPTSGVPLTKHLWTHDDFSGWKHKNWIRWSYARKHCCENISVRRSILATHHFIQFSNSGARQPLACCQAQWSREKRQGGHVTECHLLVIERTF